MSLQITNIYEAKTNLSQLVAQALAGNEVIIAKAGKPVVKLVPYEALKKPRTFGKFKGQISVSDDFDKEDKEINKMFYNGNV